MCEAVIAGQLLSALRKLGVQLSLHGDQLKLRGPHGFLTPALKQALELHRIELLQLLQAPSRPSVGRAPAEKSLYPLSHSQRQLWYEQQLDPGAIHYNVPVVIKLGASSSRCGIEQVLRSLLDRHAVLRARFLVCDDEPAMEIEPEPPTFLLPFVDLPAQASDLDLQETALDFIRHPFNLREEPPFRACLVRRGRRDSALVICIHHIAADGWSMGLLMRDFQHAYAAFAAGQPLPEHERATVGCGDFSIWQSEADKRRTMSPLVATATAALQDVPDLILTGDFRRAETPTYHGGLCTARLAPAEIDSLSSLARRCGTTLFSVFSAAFMMLLHHESGQIRFTLGTDVAGREDPVWEDVVGDFVHQIVMVADLSGNPSVEQIIERAASALLRAHSLREIPFDLLVKATRADRNSQAPLFRAKIVMQPPLPSHFETLPEFEILNIHDGSCKFDLLLNIWLTDDGAGMAIEYSRDLFSDNTASRFTQHLSRLLQMMCDETQTLTLNAIEERLSHTELVGSLTSRLSFSESVGRVRAARSTLRSNDSIHYA